MEIRTRLGTSSKACIAMSKILSLFMLILLVMMPLTEYFWHFDESISAGQDFEFGLLTTLVFFGLVLVLLHHGRQAIRLLMLMRWTSSVFRKGDTGRSVQTRLIASHHAIPLLSPELMLYVLPMQV